MRRRSFLGHALLLMGAFTCPQAAFSQSDLRADTLVVDGVERTVCVRPGPSGGPLVIGFHGHGGRAEHFAAIGLQDSWPEATFVFPQGLPGEPGYTDPDGTGPGWQKFLGDTQDRDIHLFDAMLERYGSGADASRLHVFGHSNGGRFATVVWNVRGERIASVCSASGPGGPMIGSAPRRSIFWILGENDPVLPTGAMDDSVRASRLLLQTDPATRTRDGLLSTEKTPDGLELACYVHPGGHEWPHGVAPHLISFWQRQKLPG